MEWEKLLEEERKTAELYAHIVKTQGGICGNHALPWLVGFAICALVLPCNRVTSLLTSTGLFAHPTATTCAQSAYRGQMSFSANYS